jgi:hypothetical protein
MMKQKGQREKREEGQGGELRLRREEEKRGEAVD